MPTIDIAGTIVDIPNSGQSPDWSPGVIAGFEAIASALSGLVGTGDIGRQTFVLNNSQNPGTNVTLSGLSFTPNVVRGAFIRYTVIRTTTGPTQSIAEAGEMRIVYNVNNAANQKWEVARQYTGEAQITFTVQDDGQFLFSTAGIGGVSHTGFISFVAQALTD